MVIDADDERLTQGFHGHESTDHLRWTNGNATLPTGVLTGEAEVVLALAGSTRYLDEAITQAA